MQKSKLNLVLALVLTVLVGMVGGVLWGLLYYKGWFVAYVAFIMALAMFWVYAKFRDVDKLAYVWIMVWCIVICAVSCLVALVLAVRKEFGCTLEESIKSIVEIIEYDNSLIGDILVDIGLSTLFAVLGVVFCYSYRKRKAQQAVVTDLLNGNIKHVDAEVVENTPADTADNAPSDAVDNTFTDTVESTSTDTAESTPADEHTDASSEPSADVHDDDQKPKAE